MRGSGEMRAEIIDGDVKVEQWERDEEERVICPDCGETMAADLAQLVGEHLLDCRLVRDLGTRWVAWGEW